MRILHVLVGLQRGGIETFLINIYKKIDKSKIQFDFLITDNRSSDYMNFIEKNGGRIYSYTSRRNGIIKNYKTALSFFINHKETYTIVHFHLSSLSNIAPIYAAKKAQIKNIIIHSHSSNASGIILHKIIHFLNKKIIIYLADYFFSCSLNAASWMYPEKIINSSKFSIINNGIDLEKFEFNLKSRKNIREKLNISDDVFLLGHIGRFSYPKNHSFLIDVFSELVKVVPRSILVLVGEGPDLNKVRDKIINLNLSNKVIICGVTDKVPQLLSSFDLLLMPSRYEGFPVVLVEAQASRLPCYISDVITREIVLSDLINFISLNKSPMEWAQFISSNYNQVKRTGKSSIVNLEMKSFDINKVTNKLICFYQSIE